MEETQTLGSGNHPLVALGTTSEEGAYLLRIDLSRRHELVFGRFIGGKAIGLSSGPYIYIGSALGRGTPLARRILRHGTRTPPHSPQPIRKEMLAYFRGIGLGGKGLKPPQNKKLFWNIDHLLDLQSACLRQVFLLRSPKRLENPLADMLEADPGTAVFEPGLGANDARGNTHLLQVVAGEDWWEALPEKLQGLLAAECLR